MAKSAIPGAKRTDMYRVAPESLTLVTDKKHHLYDPRNDLPVDEGLVLNIIEYGVLEPILINGNQEIVDGRQRFKAVIEANKRLKKEGLDPHLIPALIKRGPEGRLFGMGQATFIRQDETIGQKAQKVARYLNMGHSVSDAAVTFGVSETAINQWLSILDAPKEVRVAAEKGEISETAAVELAKLEGDDAKAGLKEMKSNGTKTVKAAKAIVQRTKAEKNGKSAADVKTNPAIQKRTIQNLVRYAKRLQKEGGAATEVIEESLEVLVNEKEHTYLDLVMLGARIACGDLAPSRLKGLVDLMDEAKGS